LLNHICLPIFSLYNELMKFEFETPIVILGYGTEGKSAFQFLKNQGIKDITICDEKENIETPEGIKTKLGPKAFEDLSEFKTIFRSPGVHYDLPAIQEARDRMIPVTSMTNLTLEIGRDHLTAITGSNGKTTTTGMTEAILKKHYNNKVVVGGNDRQPALEEAMEKPDEPILLEVSSFQFADLKQSPHISAILNITPNHMDWHEDLEDYIHAKGNLIAHQKKNDWAILNGDNEDSAKLAEKAPAQIFWLNEKKGENWAVWEEDSLLFQYNGNPKTLLKKSDLTLKTHPDNILCATAIGLIHGADKKTIIEALQEFKGVEGRLEFVREIDGVKFYNDTACTTPESAIVATGQFSAGKLVMLLGGSSKKADFSFLAQHIKDTKTRVVLYGAEGPHIKKAIEAEGAEDLIIALDPSKNFKDIISKTFLETESGDNIVLSPACASFDMFQNSKDRGKQFKEIVKDL
jgi:UDP-N-acetylmuramoylalanine--D-glutamate ligase